MRRGKAKKGDNAVFMCGRNVLRGQITERIEESLKVILTRVDYRKILPNAGSAENVESYIKQLYGTTDGKFTAYIFIVT